MRVRITLGSDELSNTLYSFSFIHDIIVIMNKLPAWA